MPTATTGSGRGGGRGHGRGRGAPSGGGGRGGGEGGERRAPPPAHRRQNHGRENHGGDIGQAPLQHVQHNKSVDMKKYERMISANEANFSDIQITDATTEECLICCKRNDIFGVGACRHALCIECAIRMRVIKNDDNCPICRQPMPIMSFAFASSGLETVNLEFPLSTHPDEARYKVRFQNEAVGIRYEKYLAHVCKLCVSGGERREFPSFMSLRQHMAEAHELSYCHLCLSNLALFTRERRTYSRMQLTEHTRCGDRDDKSQKGHPKCLFCEERFFDTDDRYRHLRRDHFFCQLCEVTGQAANVFFGKHEQLIRHYGDNHFLCEVEDCKKAGIAFATQIDLDIHKSKEHSGEGRRQGLQLDFQFSDRQLGQNRGRGGGHHNQQQQPVPIPQLPRAERISVVPAESPAPRDPSSFVVVPSAQYQGNVNLRYARNTGYNALQTGDFPSLAGGPPSGPPVLQPAQFPRLTKVNGTAPQASKAAPAEAFPALGGASSTRIGGGTPSSSKNSAAKAARPTTAPQPSSSQQKKGGHANTSRDNWGKHTERFDVIDDDERPSDRLENSIASQEHKPKISVVKELPQQAQPTASASQKKGAGGSFRAPAVDDFPSLLPANYPPPSSEVLALSQHSKWGKQTKAQQKNARKPLPVPEMWPAMTSSSSSATATSTARVEEEEWKEVQPNLSKKMQAKREKDAWKAAQKEEKRRKKAEEQGRFVRSEEVSDEEDEEEEEEEKEVEERKEESKPLELADIGRMIAATSKETKKAETNSDKKAANAAAKEPAGKKQQGNGGQKAAAAIEKKAPPTVEKKTEKKKGGNEKKSAPAQAQAQGKQEKNARRAETAGTPDSQLGLAAGLTSAGASLLGSLFSSVFGQAQQTEESRRDTEKSSSSSGSASSSASNSQSGAKKTASNQGKEAERNSVNSYAPKGISTAPPPGISLAPPPGFGPPPGFEHVPMGR